MARFRTAADTVARDRYAARGTDAIGPGALVIAVVATGIGIAMMLGVYSVIRAGFTVRR